MTHHTKLQKGETSMRYCKKCTMPDTRPGITFNEKGICCACTHYENRTKIDWGGALARAGGTL